MDCMDSGGKRCGCCSTCRMIEIEREATRRADADRVSAESASLTQEDLARRLKERNELTDMERWIADAERRAEEFKKNAAGIATERDEFKHKSVVLEKEVASRDQRLNEHFALINVHIEEKQALRAEVAELKALVETLVDASRGAATEDARKIEGLKGDAERATKELDDVKKERDTARHNERGVVDRLCGTFTEEIGAVRRERRKALDALLAGALLAFGLQLAHHEWKKSHGGCACCPSTMPAATAPVEPVSKPAKRWL